jgi:hypothetical protein
MGDIEQTSGLNLQNEYNIVRGMLITINVVFWGKRK